MISPSKPTCPEPDPSELRAVFGQNLRHLSKEHSSIASLCRKLGINRTQFNRYLTGESFPRPDVLHKICRFFGVDARILLEPVATIKNPNESLLDHPQIRAFFGRQPAEVPESLFPSGFYRFIRGASIPRIITSSVSSMSLAARVIPSFAATNRPRCWEMSASASPRENASIAAWSCARTKASWQSPCDAIRCPAPSLT